MSIIKDSYQITKIVVVVVSLFNLNSIQENELKSYVKLHQNEWIEQRWSEQEVEEMIKGEAKYIFKD